MIIYSVELFDKHTEMLKSEIEIPKEKVHEVSKIMGWSSDAERAFLNGIAGFNVNIEQAKSLETLLGKKFYASDLIIQISGGEVQ
ncbi:hypothetical protein BIY26_10550 [Brenneria goodwinii]|uniref:DUF7683 domain-containing protein n=1 Tax=Brenneria goodwinii TaxID=1109412 RepID=A0A0G4JX86_9GAMM|nr:hypothetical protein [Brenneria goodwinii]ATA23079.1 hypothetical protein AWC36_02565 [Brenneria goodwinii]MCG8156804.1 hypothetical protein [Brenneria goodwinii]MCG8160284.1 hypothetical protein [Brenneria goodwinii]MCG8164807.1 hypothetical protein [Brenneria goodwinii]MCG8172315.1 hypothetical protein [Brenneria goodwinii]